MNRLDVSLICEKGEAARVIEMRVRKHDGIDLLDRARQLSILRIGIGAMPLKQSTVEQHCLAVGADDVTRARHFARGT